MGCSIAFNVLYDPAGATNMGDWRVPLRYSRSQVNKAGRALLDGSEDKDVLEIVNNWRGAHGIPLNAVQTDLRKAASKTDPECDVVQRLKRLPSIRNKIQRSSKGGAELRLTQIQDIGGCRAVLVTEKKARLLYERYLDGGRIGHEIWGSNDYIATPASTGYRSFHVKIKYKSTKEALELYNGMRIEIQIRSHLQHLWATAVEIVGTMLKEPLKWGEGNPIWLRFFQLTGSIIALAEEKPPVPGTYEDPSQILKELRDCERELNALDFLIGCAEGIQGPGDERALTNRHYFVMLLDRQEKTTTLWVYTVRQIRRALDKYNQIELDLSGDRGQKDVVLVAADSVGALKRAYPNYLLDTRAFVAVLRTLLSGQSVK